MDNDGNLGSNEDNDGDDKKAVDETFDLALVLTSDGIVIINVTDRQTPSKIDFIPVPTSKIVVDRERRLAYALSGGGISIISLKCLPPMQCPLPADLNRTNDPRLLYAVPNSSGLDMVLSDDGTTGYVADYSGGQLKIARLNIEKPSFKIVAYDEPDKEMKGAVTDGASLLRLKLTVSKENLPLYENMEWRLTDPQLPDNPSANMGTLIDSDGNPTDKVTFNGDGVAEVVYKAPDSFVRRGTSEETNDKETPERQISVTLGSADTNNDATVFLDNIRLKRPPVVLVHGLWGDPSAWDEFVPKFNDKKLYGEDKEILRVNYYRAGEVLSITNMWVQDRFRNALDRAQEGLRDKGFSSAKVDIIAHSLGGLLTREYCAQNSEECNNSDQRKNKIRRFITIDTPHFGSELADVLLVYQDDKDRDGAAIFPDIDLCRETMDEFVKGGSIKLYDVPLYGPITKKIDAHPIGPNKTTGNTEGSAIDNLATGRLPDFIQSSTTQGRWSQYPPLSETLSAHTIIGLTTSALDGIDIEIFGLWRFIIKRCGFTRQNVFGSEAELNDRIVKESSQKGGVLTQYSKRMYDTDHFTVRNAQETIDYIKMLLNEPNSSDLFTK